MTDKEKIIQLRIMYTRETGELFSENIPKYADWLETSLAEKPKFMNGDKVTITSNVSGHKFSVGEKVQLISLMDDTWLAKNHKGVESYLVIQEVE